jgi:nicotinamide-nucleotide amidase
MTNILQKVSKKLQKNNLSLVSAESCTGGWVAKQITDLAGSSAIFDRGFVTYSNQAKHEMLDVLEETLNEFGAVSEEVVIEMVEGALKHSHADIAVSISGVAGPGGGTEEKPVGMVCFGWMKRGMEPRATTQIFDGDRDSVRAQSVEYSLSGIIELIDGSR